MVLAPRNNPRRESAREMAGTSPAMTKGEELRATQAPKKSDFPVSKIRRYLEPGPIVLVSSRHDGETNIMTMGWHTVMEFTPSLVGCIIAGGNHSFELIRNSGECVINLPTTALTDIVVKIGNSTGAEIDKFRQFGLTAVEASKVCAPLIGECHANFECRLHDTRWSTATTSSSSRW